MSFPFRAPVRDTTAEPLDTPYRRARQEWDARMGSAVLSARAWRMISLAALALAAALSLSLTIVALQKRTFVHVVEVSPEGQVLSVRAAHGDWSPSETQQAYFIGRFVRLVRSLPTDAVVLRENWLEAYKFLTPQAAARLSAATRQDDPFLQVGQVARIVHVRSIVMRSANTWQVSWSEESTGSMTEPPRSLYTGLFTIEMAPPRTAEQVASNPLGILISEFRLESRPMRVLTVILAITLLAPNALAQDHARGPASVVIEQANRAARRTPLAQDFTEATQFYAYAPGALYQLYASPNFVSIILLEPGETLIDRAAADTANWLVEESATGSGASRRAIVLVKPARAGVRTNLVLITDRRVYLIEAIASSAQTYAAEIAWRYGGEQVSTAQAVRTEIAAPRTLNRQYRIRLRRGARPVWFPQRVYDDGVKTWIEFPDDIATADLPPLFLITGEGLELVNYRVAGAAYEIDRLFDRAELRIGQRAPVVVRIERRPASMPSPRRDRRGRP